GGTTLGVLPGADRSAANRWVDVAVATGMGEARNAVVVRTADAVVAVGGGYGTLSEIALALRIGRPVVGLATWAIEGVEAAGEAEAAAARALELCRA
ncbi:MAG: LOG family protein, partial [Actinomycetota bacterium]|nr:LOG family protein [Actinomycetota bacterium]